MRMEHFRYLLEINNQHSITGAARSLYLGQTTLSAIVKSAEEELGFTMFSRVPKGVQCTPEGEEAMPIIQEIQELYQQVLDLDLHSDELQYTVTVLLSPTICSSLAVPLSRSFFEIMPKGNLDFRQVAGMDVSSLMTKNEASIGLTYCSDHRIDNFHTVAEKYHLKIKKLLPDRHFLLVSRDHPLAKYDRIPVDQVSNLNFALLPHYFRSDGARHIARFGPGNRYTTYSNVSLIFRAVETENMATILSGFSIFYNSGVDVERLKAIEIVDTAPIPPLNLCVIYREEDNLHPADQILLQCIMEYFDQLPPLESFLGEETE